MQGAKKPKARVQRKNIKQKNENLFLKYKSKYLCRGLQNKILGLYLCYLQYRKSQRIMTESPPKNQLIIIFTKNKLVSVSFILQGIF